MAISRGVLCCGSIVADILVRPVTEPGWGTTTWVDDIELSLGGNGGSTAYTLAKLGVPVKLFGASGKDDFGDRLLAILSEVGVDVSGVERSATSPTPTSVVLVHPDGRRALLLRPGANREAFSNGLQLAPGQLAGCAGLHLANIFSMPLFQSHAVRLLKEARDRGVRTSMDAAWDPQGLWMQTLAPCLPFTDLLFLNDDEAYHLTSEGNPEQAAARLHREGAGSVIVKLGVRGCFVSTDDEKFESPGFRVEAIDTAGAGDCFVGGFLAGLQNGFDMRRAAELANAVGAMSVSSLGSIAGVRDLDHTREWVRSRSM